jgi:m7GpppX diphosphatase
MFPIPYMSINKMINHRLIVETPKMFQHPEVQDYIEGEIHKPSKRWVHEILDFTKEEEGIRMLTDDYILLEDTERVNIMKGDSSTVLNWLVIFRDPSLRCLRDLTGDHLPILKHINSEMMKCVSTLTGVPTDQIMLYVHYHPTVYRLHIHVAYPYAQMNHCRDLYRIHSLQTIMSNLQVDGAYYKKADIQLSMNCNSSLYGILVSHQQ